MKAPKLGLFVFILFISFIIHSLLFFVASNRLLQQNHTQQAHLLMKQLNQESAALLANENFVALALLAERYSALPSVASLQLYDEQEQRIITAGSNKTQTSKTITQDVKLDNKLVGHIELSLRENSNNEIFHVIWWAILFAFLLHLCIFIAYLLIIRPRRSEYVQHLVEHEQMQTEIAQLKQELQTEREQIAQLLDEYETYQQPVEQEHHADHRHSIVMNIKFYDPNQLFHSLSPILSQKYLQTCQVLLQRSVLLSCEQFNMKPDQVIMLQSFNEQGATISIASHTDYAIDCLMTINSLAHSLFDTLHQTYKENKRFTLPICSAIAETSSQYDALTTATRLTQHLKAQQKAIYLKHEHLKPLTQSYQFTSFENPSNSLMRQSYLITGMNAQLANLVSELRANILHNPS